eukprot:Lithocolla_globosa_v1_NODE_631_length_3555_cov_10.210571.p2 type:complete len:227 gc:universal NODE_631_length_3555_cov_10.210571:478-1158(+)
MMCYMFLRIFAPQELLVQWGLRSVFLAGLTKKVPSVPQLIPIVFVVKDFNPILSVARVLPIARRISIPSLIIVLLVQEILLLLQVQHQKVNVYVIGVMKEMVWNARNVGKEGMVLNLGNAYFAQKILLLLLVQLLHVIVNLALFQKRMLFNVLLVNPTRFLSTQPTASHVQISPLVLLVAGIFSNANVNLAMKKMKFLVVYLVLMASMTVITFAWNVQRIVTVMME